jgi:pseudouridine kinase
MEKNKPALPLLVIGTVFVDIKGYPFGQYHPADRNVGEVKTMNGGVGHNIAIDCAKCGAKVRFVSTCDNGPYGLEIVKKLRASGVDTDNMQIVKGGGTGLWLAVFDEKGELAGSISQMPPIDQLENYILRDGESIIRTSAAVALELDLSARLSEYVISVAEANNKPVYGVVGNMAVVLENRKLISGLDCFICNETEAGRFFICDLSTMTNVQVAAFLADVARKEGLRSIVVTLGARGCVWYDHLSGKSGYEPAIDTEVTDTAGAGDAFFSGTIVRLMNGRSLSEAVKNGIKAASQVIASITNTL